MRVVTQVVTAGVEGEGSMGGVELGELVAVEAPVVDILRTGRTGTGVSDTSNQER
jgi:hypothetical protein